LTSGSFTAEPPVEAAPPPERGPGAGRYLTGTLFLLPAFVLLFTWMVYPTVYTIFRSFYGLNGFNKFVGIDNYKSLFVPFNFSTNVLLISIKNNLIWVLVVPAFVTAVGLIFAVLTERISWSVAFKTVVFLPMAISAFATGVTWRIMYIQDPNLGAVNALGRVVVDRVNPPGVLSDASPSTPKLVGSAQTGMRLTTSLAKANVSKARAASQSRPRLRR